jgi:hypothetical protein
LDRFKKFGVNRAQDRKLVNAMCGLFRGQTRLRVVKLTEAYVKLVTGKRLLQALAKGSGEHVTNLNIVDFFQYGLAMYRVPNFHLNITSFSNLRKLSINFNCLSDEILVGVARQTRGRLRRLTVRVQERDPHGHRISGRTWKATRALCPKLQVDFEFDSICTYPDVVPLLPPEIPLRSLRVWTGMDLEDESWVPGFICYTTENFSHCLGRCGTDLLLNDQLSQLPC